MSSEAKPSLAVDGSHARCQAQYRVKGDATSLVDDLSEIPEHFNALDQYLQDDWLAGAVLLRILVMGIHLAEDV